VRQYELKDFVLYEVFEKFYNLFGEFDVSAYRINSLKHLPELLGSPFSYSFLQCGLQRVFNRC
jgi:hypothetical protein